ncbi:AAA family ATPase [Salibacterium aidingense]|uniref:AAA family ATPase n=1 Tax=Salibacterium aidingense TaxID=384933 RepID=UPI0006841C58|nr:AAA family ATPase [Salibacterium aidingense]
MSESKYESIKTAVDNWEKEKEVVKVQTAKNWLDQLNPDHKKERDLSAKIYGLMARDRFNLRYRFDPMVKHWMHNGRELLEEEAVIQKLSTLEQLENIKEMAFTHPLTSIRETDQSSAREKAARQLYDTADKELHYLKQVQHFLENGKHVLEETAEDYNYDLALMQNLTEEGLSAYTDLFEASGEYLRTASGSFYSPEQVKQMKEALSRINEKKDHWEEAMKHTKTSHKPDQNPLYELEQLIGLENVKKRVHRLYHYLQYQKLRKEKGYQLNDERSLHMILTGNPGTGKTMLAHLLAQIYHQLGLLQRSEVLEADRSHLVGGYVGQTEEKTMNLVKEAVGGVLFIDEAYSLKREGMSANDFGQTAIDTLITAMTSGEYAGTFAVILAGYPEEMRQFLRSNPGLRSRFPESNHIHLPDYSLEELQKIAEKTALDNDFVISEEAAKELKKRIENEQVDDSFGNARTIKDIVMDAIFQKGAKIGAESTGAMDDFALLTAEDMKDPAAEENNEHQVSPLHRLESLIGLDNVKQEMRKLASFIKIQTERRKAGQPVAPIQLHTVFTGPPGTGKTTVAQLYAEILKEMDLLKRGHLIVVGRSELVAEYTGQTAVKTRRKIREALGGVLFIDEAYSLAAAGKADFGREALDTLVEEMTKQEHNLVVILSGYPGPMDQLFQMNPGLQSRFKKSFYFPSFPVEDLVHITIEYCRRFGYFFEKGADIHLSSVFKQMDTSGNARFAEDMAEELFQQQAYRLSQEEELSEEKLVLVTIEDVEAAFQYKQSERRNEKHDGIRDRNRS